MKISNKLRNKILNGISAATMAALDHYCDFHKEGPPDTWTDEQKRLFDLINDMEHRISRKVDGVMTSS